MTSMKSIPVIILEAFVWVLCVWVGWLQFFPHMIDYDSMERRISLHDKPGCSDGWPLWMCHCDENEQHDSWLLKLCYSPDWRVCGMITILSPYDRLWFYGKTVYRCTISQDAAMNDHFWLLWAFLMVCRRIVCSHTFVVVGREGVATDWNRRKDPLCDRLRLGAQYRRTSRLTP